MAKHVIVSGTELKMNIHIDPFDDFHMKDYDFECKFYIFPKKVVTVKKEDMVPIDDDDYLALVDTTTLGIGPLHLTVTAFIPDKHFTDKIRREIKCVDPQVEIINC